MYFMFYLRMRELFMQKVRLYLLLFLTVIITSCAVFDTRKPNLPMKPIYQFFDETDGALKRYKDLLKEAKDRGSISETQYEIYILEIEAVKNEVNKIREITNDQLAD